MSARRSDPRDQLTQEWLTPDGVLVRVVLVNVWFQRCTKCKRAKPASEFGLRCMGANFPTREDQRTAGKRPTIEFRNQPQCASCRSRIAAERAT
jgi:hypothetical protein